VNRLVVFDLDGTLIDSAGDLAQAMNATLARLAPGTPPLPLTTVRRFIGNGAGVLVARSLQAVGLEVRPEDALPVFLDCYRSRLLDTTRLYPGVRETLDQLAGRTLAVLSNKPGDMSRTILQGLGVAGRFARIWGAGDVPARKPDPTGLQRLMAELDASATETVLVGDSAVDIQTGRAAGVRTVGVSYGLDPESLQHAAPDVVVDDARDLARVL
jgi:phosphoglycolate phosphatase